MEFTPKSITQLKLLLLYILEQFKTPMTENQLLRICVETGLVGYFDFKQHMDELLSGGQVSEHKTDRVYYALSDEGSETLRVLLLKLPTPLKDAVDNYLAANRDRIKSETLYSADVEKNDAGNYIVTLRAYENTSAILDLKLETPNAEHAELMRSNWEKAACEIYQFCLQTLSYNYQMLVEEN